MEEQEDIGLKDKINSMVNRKMSQCSNSVLTSQMLKAFPDVNSHDRRNSFYAALQQLSEESDQSEHKDNKTEVKVQFPIKSVVNDEVTIQECVIAISEDILQTDGFVRKLAIPIQEKRLYRMDFVANIWMSSSFVKFRNDLESKYDNFLNLFDCWNDTFNVIEGIFLSL